MPHLNGVSAHINWKGWIEKLDANRNSVWTKTVNNESSNWNSTDQIVVKELQNGETLVAGSLWQKINTSDTENYHFGCLTKIDVNGTTTWQRVYRIANDTLVYLVYDMKPTTDGGFVISGEARDSYPPYNDPSQRGWLIKVDSNGCMSATDPQCDPLNIPDQPHAMEFQVFPNPATDVLYINSKSSKPSTIVVCDLVGRSVAEQQLHFGVNQLELHNAPSGVYVYKVVDTTGTIQRGKFVKE